MPSMRRRACVVACALLAVAPALADPAVAATARPTVTALSRPLAPAGGGVRVVLTGTGFTGVRAVRFGTTAGRSITVSGPRKLTVTVPAHAPGAVDITVVTDHGTSAATSADRIRFVGAPVVTSLNPASGDTAGGRTVTVHGKQFYGSPTVTFGKTAGTAVHVVDARTLTVRVPAQSAHTVDVRVHTIGGTSAVVTADHYDYLLPPVTGASIADTTATSVLLQWTPSARNSTEITRDGSTIATVTSQTSEYRDTGLASASKHTYSLVAVAGGAASRPVTVSTTTQSTARPATPELVLISAGMCGSGPDWIGALVGNFSLDTHVSDPDAPNSSLRADFELRDLGTAPGDQPTDLVTSTDPAGQSSFRSREGDASQQFDSRLLTDGHRYETDAIAEDTGGTRSNPGPPCEFTFDSSAPTITNLTGPASAKVGTPITFTVSGADQPPSEGFASGIAHFGYSFVDASYLAGDGGTHVVGTGDAMTRSATITFTPSQWGQNTLYVHVLDQAGNTSSTYTYNFYVSG